jgi:hypothetical protein
MPWWKQGEGLVRVRVEDEKEDDDSRSLAIAAASSYKRYIKRICMLVHVQSVNYLGTS